VLRRSSKMRRSQCSSWINTLRRSGRCVDLRPSLSLYPPPPTRTSADANFGPQRTDDSTLHGRFRLRRCKAFRDGFAAVGEERVDVFSVRPFLSFSPLVRCVDGFSQLNGTHRTKSLRQMRITSKGFQFLLEDVNTQLWDLLLSYLEESQVCSVFPSRRILRLTSHPVQQDLVETIGFLFMLGSLELGRAYLTEPLSDVQLSVLRDLADYGLVYRPSVRLFPLFPSSL
jgi:hypothetical protein